MADCPNCKEYADRFQDALNENNAIDREADILRERGKLDKIRIRTYKVLVLILLAWALSATVAAAWCHGYYSCSTDLLSRMDSYARAAAHTDNMTAKKGPR